MDKEKSEKEIYSKNLKTIRRARGAILEASIGLEMQLNVFLAFHFGKNKEIQEDLFFQLFITNKLTFDAKIELFDIAIKKYYSSFTFKNYFNVLKGIIVDRNNFAHQHLDVGTGDIIELNDGVSFFKHDKKQNAKVENYDSNRITEILKVIAELKAAIIELSIPFINK